MPLYIKFGDKRKLSRKRELVRLDTAYSIFSSLFNFIEKDDKSFTIFENVPFPSITNRYESFNLETGLIEKTKSITAKIDNSTGFEIKFVGNVENIGISFVYTLLPAKYSFHYDALLEIIPNGYVSKFIEIDRYIPHFRSILEERIKKYNSDKDEDILHIEKAIISTDGKEIHSFNDYKFFYSRNPENFINELIGISKHLKERLYHADKKRFAKELIGYNTFLLFTSSIANKHSVNVSGGSITIIPENEKNMSNFSTEIVRRLEKVADLYPTKEDYRKCLEEAIKVE
jgi:hypothetical protein